ncbi:hypothetical protein PNP85_05890 [Halobacterium salinarum]|uniref:hypothetical protein n=1 Tax=Halobacterium salinarum TaxID=2242 RepID=UPI002557ABD9|nr:hypothetical protein [Halobacterium salinarum]MDL0139032.1 hypothetical protein [Halobacterium salinarum]
MLFETIAVAALWVAGFRPSLRASTLYFVVEQAVYLLLALAFLGAEPGPWRAVGFHVLSIAGAALLSFTDGGRQSRRWLRHQGWRLLKRAAKVK